MNHAAESKRTRAYRHTRNRRGMRGGFAGGHQVENEAEVCVYSAIFRADNRHSRREGEATNTDWLEACINTLRQGWLLRV